MSKPVIGCIAPFFVSRSVATAIAFYRDQLGFDVTCVEPEHAPFFAIVARDNAMLFLKQGGVDPMPNPTRDPEMRWDAFVYVPEPDALAAEFASRGVSFSVLLGDTDDGLRGFELKDADGYVLFFGRPRER